jgi:hypothetical protein
VRRKKKKMKNNDAKARSRGGSKGEMREVRAEDVDVAL